MKIEQRQTVQVNPNLKMKKVGQFTVDGDNIAHIMKILSGIYTNPAQAVVRELVSNSLDAHREVGYSGPVQVSLPSVVEPYLVITDNGPGLSPHEMVNVYIKYGASTRRTSDEMVGGFGIGAKTPLAIADSFMVTSRNGGTVSHYVVGPDRGPDAEAETDGKILLHLHSEERCSKNDTGLTVRIPVGARDIDEMRKYAEWAFPYLGDAVKVTTGDYNPRDLEKDLIMGANQGVPGGWAFYSGDYWASKRIGGVAVVGGVPYDISDAINAYDGIMRNAVVWLSVSEVKVAPNREALQVTDKTKQALERARERIVEGFAQEVRKSVEGATDVYDAMGKFEQARKLAPGGVSIGSFEWNGETISNKWSPVDYNKATLLVYGARYRNNRGRQERWWGFDWAKPLDGSLLVVLDDKSAKRVPSRILDYQNEQSVDDNQTVQTVVRLTGSHEYLESIVDSLEGLDVVWAEDLPETIDTSVASRVPYTALYPFHSARWESGFYSSHEIQSKGVDVPEEGYWMPVLSRADATFPFDSSTLKTIATNFYKQALTEDVPDVPFVGVSRNKTGPFEDSADWQNFHEAVADWLVDYDWSENAWFYLNRSSRYPADVWKGILGDRVVIPSETTVQLNAEKIADWFRHGSTSGGKLVQVLQSRVNETGRSELAGVLGTGHPTVLLASGWRATLKDAVTPSGKVDSDEANAVGVLFTYLDVIRRISASDDVKVVYNKLKKALVNMIKATSGGSNESYNRLVSAVYDTIQSIDERYPLLSSLSSWNMTVYKNHNTVLDNKIVDYIRGIDLICAWTETEEDAHSRLAVALSELALDENGGLLAEADLDEWLVNLLTEVADRVN